MLFRLILIDVCAFVELALPMRSWDAGALLMA